MGHLQILRGFGLHRLSLGSCHLDLYLLGVGALHFLDWGAKLKFLWEGGEKGISLEKPAERIVSVKGGWNITTLAERYYHAANPILLDLILECNPQIIDLNRIYINQQINIPIITEELLLIPTPDQGYKIHLGTFSDKRPIEAYKNNPALRDKKLEAVPRQVSPQTTWLRVMAAEFRTKEEGLMAIRNLRQQGLLPAFAGSSKQISTQR